MAEALLKYETIDQGQIDRLMDRKEPGAPADWGGDDSTNSGKPSGTAPANTSSDEDEESGDDSVDDGAPSLH